ncbi:hypothetical protein JTE90_003507, partial [Oedothorax gibbosus]
MERIQQNINHFEVLGLNLRGALHQTQINENSILQIENSYNRIVNFVQRAGPEEINPGAVKEILEYLAETRRGLDTIRHSN